MPLSLKFIGALRHISGKTQLTINFQKDSTIKELLSRLSKELPQLEKTFSEQQLNSSSNALILVNGREISVLKGLDTELKDGDEIVFVPVVHGG